jgi:tetratricopeptide (TPR) repeat protein
MQDRPVEASHALPPKETPTATTVATDAAPGAPAVEPKSRKWLSSPFRTFGYFRKRIGWWWSLLVKLSTALMIGVAGYVVILSVTQNTITIEPLSTPKVMVDNGYTPEVAAAHFRAALVSALIAAQLSGGRLGPQLALRGEQPDVVVPSTGISAQTIANSIRKFLPISQAPIISGEFTVTDNRLWLRLRSGGRDIYSSERGVNPERVRQLMDDAAPAVLYEVWPIYLAFTSYRRNPVLALEVADRVIETAARSSQDVRTAYVLKGLIYVDQKRYRRALDSFNSALQLETRPNRRAEYHIARGFVFRLQRKTKQADIEFAKAEELGKDDPQVLMALRLVQVGPVAVPAELRKLKQKNILLPGVHSQVGALFSQLGMIDDAIVEYLEAIRIDPNDIAAHINLGNAYAAKSQTEDAAASYWKAIDIDSHDERIVTAHMALGTMMHEQGRLDEAAAEFRKIIETPLPTSFLRFGRNIHQWAPSDVDNRTRARNALGAVLRDQEKLDEAMAQLTKNIKFEPRNAEAHRQLGLVLRDQKKPEEAVRELRKAIKLESTDPAAHFDLASILRDDQPDEAIAEFRETIKLAPKNPQAYRELGLVLFNQNKPDEAISELRRAITLQPDEPVTHKNLGVMLRSQGQVEEAIDAIREAIRLAPHFTQAYLELATMYSEQRNLDGAVLELRKGIETAPEDISLRLELASILGRQGDFDGAVAEYRETLKRDSTSGTSHYNLAIALANQSTHKRSAEKVAALIEACQLLAEGKRLASLDPDFGAAIKWVNQLMPKPQQCPPRPTRRVGRR